MSNAEEALFNLKKLRHVMPKYQYNELTVLLSELDGSGLFYNTAKHFDNLLRNATLSISKIPSLYGNKREVVYLHYKRGADSVDIYELGKGPFGYMGVGRDSTDTSTLRYYFMPEFLESGAELELDLYWYPSKVQT